MKREKIEISSKDVGTLTFKPEPTVNGVLDEDIKESIYIWYKGSSGEKSWSCPCVILDVDRKNRAFTILAFDEFNIPPRGYSFDELQRENGRMRICSREEVVKFFDNAASIAADILGCVYTELAVYSQMLEDFKRSPEETTQEILESTQAPVSISTT